MKITATTNNTAAAA